MANSSLKPKPIHRALLLLALILYSAVQSNATDFTYDGLIYTTLTDNTCETKQGIYSDDTRVGVAGNTVSGDLVIHETVYDNDGKAYTVTAIGDYAFYDCEGLTSVTIPNTVTSIGVDAFHYCTSLQKVNITDLDAWCRISFSSSDSNPLNYAQHLYLNDNEVTDLVIPETITSIGDYAFYYCKGLTSVTIPNTVTSIGENAFRGCMGIQKVNITDLDAWCKISFSSDWSNPLRYAQHLYLNDTEVTDLVIPESVTAIGDNAFRDCEGLTSVTIHKHVTSIGVDAFYLCTNIQNVNITDLDAWCRISFSSDYSNPLYYARHLYLNDTEITDLKIPESLTAVGNYAFAGFDYLTAITIPNTITSIGNGAFADCYGLTSVAIPNSVTAIGERAFDGCKGLTSVTIPNSVTSIGREAFYGCKGLTTLTIPNSVTEIGEQAFYGCLNITTVNFDDGESELTLTTSAFRRVAPTEVYFGRQMDFTTVPCTALKTVTFGEYVTSIADGTFKGATALRSVTSHNTVPQKIGETTFADDTYSAGVLYVPESSIATYQVATGWKNFLSIKTIENTGISDINNDGGTPFSIENGAICVSGDAYVRIVSMTGSTVYSGRGETRINVIPGIYIVINGNKATKVAVR